MVDIVDLATDHYERSMTDALNAITANLHKPVVGNGYCLACGEPIEEGSMNPRFCDSDCRDDYDKLVSKGR
jgi:hypothetical protein